jgi:hypothetical protein
MFHNVGLRMPFQGQSRLSPGPGAPVEIVTHPERICNGAGPHKQTDFALFCRLEALSGAEQWQNDRERAACSFFALNFHRAAMTLDDLFDHI